MQRIPPAYYIFYIKNVADSFTAKNNPIIGQAMQNKEQIRQQNSAMIPEYRQANNGKNYF
ncbi:hypothetical protein [Parafilimonas sp.]|uniref:hypothetical protein n=1 Tax=Parafilimonas sp. TaxID=1969739 RepID=UPI0039E2AE05